MIEKSSKVSRRRGSSSYQRIGERVGRMAAKLGSFTRGRNGSKKEAVEARKEGQVRFVHVTPDVFPSSLSFGPGDARSVVCLDLGKFGPKGAIRYVRAITERRLDDPDSVVPSIVVIGSTAHMQPEEADSVEEGLIDAGAVFYETTEEAPTFDAALDELRKEMSEIYEVAEQNEAGYFTSKGNGHKVVVSRDSSHDLSPYYDETHQMDDDDFEYLTQRIDLPDDSPEFED